VADLSSGEIELGGTIGRYIVLSRIGAGAMGVVYAAYDPELDSKIALKVLHPEAATSEHGSSGREPERARKLAGEALAAFVKGGTFAKKLRVDAERFAAQLGN